MLTQPQREAARQLRERYGKQKLLSNSLMLSNALGDLLGEDGKMLRSRVRMAMDAGVGKLYLEQVDVPGIDFGGLVTARLQGECGFSHEVTADMKAFFDELCGVPAQETPVPEPVAVPRTPAPEPTPVPAPLPVDAPPPPVTQSPPAQPETNDRVSLKKLYLVTLLPFLAIEAYVAIDYFTTHWIMDSAVYGFHVPLTLGRILSVPQWYRFLVPLVLPYLLPLLTAVSTTRVIRRNLLRPLHALTLAVRFGTLAAWLSLVAGNLFLPLHSYVYNAGVVNFLWRHYVILCFEDGFAVTAPSNFFVYVCISLFCALVAALLARHSARGK